MATTDLFDVSDTDLAPTKITGYDLVSGLLNKRFGLFTRIRRSGEENWVSCMRTAPFAYIMPQLVPKKKSFSNLNGIVYVCSDVKKLAAKTQEAVNSGQIKDGGFFIPMFLGPDLDAQIPSKIFDFGHGVFAVPLLIPHTVKPNSLMSLYLICFNLTYRKAKCKLSVENLSFDNVIAISDEGKANLEFEIYPGKTLFNKIPIIVSNKAKPKEYTIKVLCATSMGEKLASGIATAAISIGLSVLLGGGMAMYSYNKGKGFTVKFTVADDSGRVKSPYVKRCVQCGRDIPLASEECAFCGSKQP